MKINNLNNIPLRIKIGCLGLFLILLFICVIFLTGFIQIFSFLLDTWLGALIVGLFIAYYLLKKVIPIFRHKKNTSNHSNKFTEAEYVEIDENEENKN